MNKKVTAIIVCVLLVAGGIFLIKQRQKTTMVSQEQTEAEMRTSGEAGNSSPTVTDTPDIVPVISQISLTVSSPAAGATVTTSKVIVKGKTLPKAEIFANEAEGVADLSGNFSLTVNLDEGENSIIVTAVDQDGNVAEKEILVTYDAGE